MSVGLRGSGVKNQVQLMKDGFYGIEKARSVAEISHYFPLRKSHSDKIESHSPQPRTNYNVYLHSVLFSRDPVGSGRRRTTSASPHCGKEMKIRFY